MDFERKAVIARERNLYLPMAMRGHGPFTLWVIIGTSLPKNWIFFSSYEISSGGWFPPELFEAIIQLITKVHYFILPRWRRCKWNDRNARNICRRISIIIRRIIIGSRVGRWNWMGGRSGSKRRIGNESLCCVCGVIGFSARENQTFLWRTLEIKGYRSTFFLLPLQTSLQ